MIEYKYKKKENKFTENGHTMFEEDVLQRLKRLAYLEEQIKQERELFCNCELPTCSFNLDTGEICFCSCGKEFPISDKKYENKNNLQSKINEQTIALEEVKEFLGHILPKIGEQAFNEIWGVVESALIK